MLEIPNPYALLRLPNTATNKDVINRANALSKATPDQELKEQYSRCVTALTLHPVERAWHRFWNPEGSPDGGETIKAFVDNNRNVAGSRGFVNAEARRFIKESCKIERLLEIFLPSIGEPKWSQQELIENLPIPMPPVSIDPEEFFS